MWPWGAVYCAQVVIAMVVFNLIEGAGGGVIGAIISGTVFMLPTIAMYRAKALFRGPAATTDT